MNPRARALIEMRAYELGMCATNQPLRMLPLEVSFIPEISLQPIPRLENMVKRYNMDQFDRLSKKGYRLDLTKGEYEKVK
jgi:hypothetical protein